MSISIKTPRYGLIGSSLKHSFSPQIHKYLGISEYDLIETTSNEIKEVLNDRNYSGFNVTIPYKIEVLKYCDYIDPLVSRIGSANTIVRRDNKLYAYNTDIDGFIYMTKLAKLDLNKKRILILGSGGASLAVQAACNVLGASEISVVSRTGKLNYQNIKSKSNCDIIVNTTPIGMYPNNLNELIDLNMFPNCCGVVDIIYNPWKTALLIDAEEKGIPCIDGLPMLVYQAKRAEEHFLNKSIADGEAVRVYHQIRRDSTNIVLIGMPGSGKSSIGQKLAEATGKKLIDLDTEIIKTSGKTIPQIFSEDGEDKFRAYESDEVKKAGKLTGIILVTGGGIVKYKRNYAPLHQNGIIYRICRDTDKLDNKDRPLSGSKERMKGLFKERDPLYGEFADRNIDNNGNIDIAVTKIVEDFNETVYY